MGKLIRPRSLADNIILSPVPEKNDMRKVIDLQMKIYGAPHCQDKNS